MADIQFQDEQFGARSQIASQPSLLTRVVYASGLANDEAGATKVLLGAAVVIAILAIGVFLFLQPSKQPLQPVNVNIGRTP